MEFHGQKTIYLQIADRLCDRILAHELSVGDKLPSVRELASDVEVNVNTIVRTFDWLQEKGIVEARRGQGNYVTETAREKIEAVRREEFFHVLLPTVFHTMRALGITIDEVSTRYDEYRA